MAGAVGGSRDLVCPRCGSPALQHVRRVTAGYGPGAPLDEFDYRCLKCRGRFRPDPQTDALVPVEEQGPGAGV